MNSHAKSITQLFIKFQASDDGLSNSEAKKRLETYGRNNLPASTQRYTAFKIFVDQWKSPLIIVLFVAAIASLILAEYLDSIVIFLTIIINVGIGYGQEYKANKALEKLSKIVTYNAIVLRDGQKIQIESSEIVLGDILYIKAGDKIQADGRILKLKDLEIDESVLTGESQNVVKKKKDLKKNTPVGDRINMVFRGTTVANGIGTVLVTGTGLNTQIGEIASLVSETKEEKTPLQKQLAHLGKILSYLVICISTFLFILGIFSSNGMYSNLELFQTAVAVGVAAIPEGLIIALTVILAVGMQYILKKKALVRKLVAAETLGSVSVICTDKTGTLTEGKMKVIRIISSVNDVNNNDIIDLCNGKNYEDIKTALKIGLLCNDSIIDKTKVGKIHHFLGNMTDVALAEAGAISCIDKDGLEKIYRRKDEIDFSSKRKYMATLHDFEHESRIYVKGAPEFLLNMASHYEENGVARKMTQAQKKWFIEKEEELTGQGLRVISVGYKKTEKQIKNIKEKNIKEIILVGFFVLQDPLRPDVKKTLEEAQKAGIRVVIITGDHVSTASVIGREIGLEVSEDSVFNGEQLHSISKEKLREAVKKINIFARVDPKDKIHIVQAFKANGEVVAMTGDGINDAPALKGADIGIALGSGTDVAKETADLVLLDDKFSTIVLAIKEGRSIYQNIKKVLIYLLSHSFTEIILIGGSLIAGLPLAVIPAQILWTNLIEDSFPSMALAFDKGDRENMLDKPRKKGEKIIDLHMKIMISIISIIASGALLGLFVYLNNNSDNLKLTRTIIFATLGFNSLLFIFPVRSMRHMLWKINPFSNKYIIFSVIFGATLLTASIYWAPLQLLLKTVPLTFSQWGIVFVFSAIDVVLIEIMKYLFIVRSHRANLTI